MLLTSIDSLKKRLWISSDEYNTELSSIIERATKIIETEIWDISEKNIIERVDSFWNKKIYTKKIINSIFSVKKINWKNYEIDFFDWYIIYLKKNIPSSKKWVLVEYSSWFSTIPADLEEICLDLCIIFISESSFLSSKINTEKLVDKNIKTKKLWDLMITYFWENEKIMSSKDVLTPTRNIKNILNKYKSFSGIWR